MPFLRVDEAYSPAPVNVIRTTTYVPCTPTGRTAIRHINIRASPVWRGTRICRRSWSTCWGSAILRKIEMPVTCFHSAALLAFRTTQRLTET